MDIGSIIGIATGGIGALVGIVGTAAKYGGKIRDIKVAAKESKQAWVAIDLTIEEYQRANSDGEITPDELKSIIEKLAIAGKEGMEAQQAVEKVLR